MRRIEDFAGNTLNWIQPRPLSRQFELRQDGDVLATLRFESEFGSLARAESLGAGGLNSIQEGTTASTRFTPVGT